MLKMMQNKKGFTLIELVMVIVILGILAAVAIPRYIDLQQEALDASLNGICGSVKSTAAILVATSAGGYGRGALKSRAVIASNTTIDPTITLDATVAAPNIQITYQGSTRNCDLTNLYQ